MTIHSFVARAAVVLGTAVLLVLSPRFVEAQPVVPAGFEDVLIAAVPNATALAVVPGGRLLIGSQLGRIYVFTGGTLRTPAALDLGSSNCAYRERGLTGIAVDPQFATNRFIYVGYVFNKFGDCNAEVGPTPVSRVSRFVLNDDNTIARTSEHVLIDNVPNQTGAHSLDDIDIGPDGNLYITIGDGGCDYAGDSGCFNTNDAAQDRRALVGKLIRITRDGGIPAGNPFTGANTVRCHLTGVAPAGSICQEIYAYGLRNPWRLTFDPNVPGRLLINDVGQDTWEEINEAIAGANYGWNSREGFCVRDSLTNCSPTPPAGLTNPIFAYDHSECAAVTGGAFVPRGIWPQEYDGVYMFSDWVCGKIFKLVRQPNGTYAKQLFAHSLGVGSAVELAFVPHAGRQSLFYTSSENGGELRRITFIGDANDQPVAAFSASPRFGPLPLTVDFNAAASTDPDGDTLTYRWTFGDGTPDAFGVTVRHVYSASGVFNPVLTVTDPAGASSTATTRIDAGNTPPQPAISSPGSSQQFAVGDTIVLQGSATDAEDGQLPGTSLTWVVLLHHNTHTHGFLPPTTGSRVEFRAPGPENLEAAATSYLEIHLTARDSRGLETRVEQNLMPRFARLDFTTDPPGARLRVDDADVTAPASFMSWVNFPVAVEAPAQTGPDGSQLVFARWSDGGAQTHQIVTPAAPSAYTAFFTAQSPGTQAPYGGTPAPIPGVIEAERYDLGGSGVAYLDNTAVNSGGQFRTDAVDVETASDTGAGFNVGWAFAGEWLEYTVNVAAAGTYDIEVRVASAGAGGTFHIEVNGVDKTGPLTVPDTGAWQAWTTLRRAGVALSGGSQLWRLVMDANGSTAAVGNFNFIRVSGVAGGSRPYGGTPAQLPGMIEAENFDEGGPGVAYADTTPANSGGAYRNEAVDIEPSADTGGGNNVGWMVAGEWLNYTVDVAVAGTYNIDMRVASAGAGGTFHIEVNGVDRTGPVTVPNTGGWQAWTTLRRAVALSAGSQVWRLVMDSNGSTTAVGNVNFIRVSGSSESTPFGGTPAALPGSFEAENFDEGGAGIAYVDTTPANFGGAYRNEAVDIEPAADAGGGNNVGWMVAGEWLNYTVDVVSAGTYDLEVRVASAGNGGTFHIEVGGSHITGPIQVPDTGGWQTWTTLRIPGIGLTAGRQIWRIVMDSNGPTTAVGNLNWVRIAGGGLVRGPYLQQLSDDSVIVVWATRDPGAGEVRYARGTAAPSAVPSQSRLVSAAVTGLGYDYYQHETHLAGLSPATTYSYDVFVAAADATPGRQYSFSTAPATGTGTVRFIAFGDSGVGSTAQHQLAARMAADTFDLAIHTGDVAYGFSNGTGGANYQQLNDWVFAVYGAWLPSKPFFPSIGNHDDEIDAARPYRDVFVLPSNGASSAYPDHAERYYSYDYGSVHFVALDTQLAFGDPARRQAQLAWLEADLAATTQPWRVVYFHRPPYSAGDHGSELDVRQAFSPVLERYGVQLVVNGHDHSYERTIPLRENSSTGSAAVYVITGGGGGPLYPAGKDRWTAVSRSLHHYVRTTVGGCTLEVEAVGLDGSVFDRYVLDRCTQALDAVPPQVSITSPANGAQVSGTLDVAAAASDDTRVEKVDLFVNGVLHDIDTAASYSFRLDTAALPDGQYTLEARAYDLAGRVTRSQLVSITVANGSSPRNVVLYASDVSVIQGNWSRLSSTTGAGGLKMTSTDRAALTVATPLASPADYFEATFNAVPGTYRIWLRLRAAADSKFNESVWVQLSDAVDAAGTPLWRIGSETALLVNLEDCSGCGVSSWGWQDNSWWLNESSVVRFTGAGPHTIRIQIREDGVDIDQIVLSPAAYFSSPPGAVRNDVTIVPK
jgi:glucose/arabinose dehydrogenase/PKD repeat protein